MKTEAEKAAGRRYYERNKAAVIARTVERRKTHPRTDTVSPRARRRASEWYKANPDAQRRRHGLPPAPYPSPALCECCGRPPGKRAMHLDHCHLTGEFRGWLCGLCNKGIGALQDTIGGVENALRYLRRAYRISPTA